MWIIVHLENGAYVWECAHLSESAHLSDMSDMAEKGVERLYYAATM